MRISQYFCLGLGQFSKGRHGKKTQKIKPRTVQSTFMAQACNYLYTFPCEYKF